MVLVEVTKDASRAAADDALMKFGGEGKLGAFACDGDLAADAAIKLGLGGKGAASEPGDALLTFPIVSSRSTTEAAASMECSCCARWSSRDVTWDAGMDSGGLIAFEIGIDGFPAAAAEALTKFGWGGNEEELVSTSLT